MGATLKQKIAFKKMVENGGSISKAMIASKYSKATAHTPSKLTSTEGWKELMEKYLPEKKLLKVADEGLRATSVRFTPEGEQIKVADYSTRHKYLETGLKVRGRLKEQDNGGNTTNIVNILSNEQAERIARSILSRDAKRAESLNRLPDSNEPKV